MNFIIRRQWKFSRNTSVEARMFKIYFGSGKRKGTYKSIPLQINFFFNQCNGLRYSFYGYTESYACHISKAAPALVILKKGMFHRLNPGVDLCRQSWISSDYIIAIYIIALA